MKKKMILENQVLEILHFLIPFPPPPLPSTHTRTLSVSHFFPEPGIPFKHLMK